MYLLKGKPPAETACPEAVLRRKRRAPGTRREHATIYRRDLLGWLRLGWIKLHYI